MQMFDAVSLQSPEVIGIAEICAQFFEDAPIPLRAFATNFPVEILLEIGLELSLSISVLSTSSRNTIS